MTVAARAIQDGGEFGRRPRVRLKSAGRISGRVRTLWANELSGGEDDDEENGGLLQSSAYSSSSVSPNIPLIPESFDGLSSDGRRGFQRLDESSPLTNENHLNWCSM